MQVAVIGAGIVGVTTAYELALDGHEVTVYERHGSVAAEASFANAGIVASSYIAPAAAPGLRSKALRALFDRHAPMHFNARVSPSALSWMWKWWRACGHQDYAERRSALQHLALFSRQRLNDITHQLQLDYERSEGLVVLLRTPRDFALAQPGLALLAEAGIKHHVLDASQCLAAEPGLHRDTALHAGIYLPDDEVGNCRQFAHLLRGEAQALGVRFRFHAEVERIVAGPPVQLTVRGASTFDSQPFSTLVDPTRTGFAPTLPEPMEQAAHSADAVVMCTAIDSAALLAPLGLRLPLASVYGYSITAPMRRVEQDPDRGPRSAVMDEHYKVAISRLGSRVRVAGGIEFGGPPAKHHRAALDTLYKALNDWYPGVAQFSQAQRWKGARPMLPDGLPLLGPSGIPGIWLNIGHGSSGWTLACGSARTLADFLASRTPEVDTSSFGIERLRR